MWSGFKTSPNYFYVCWYGGPGRYPIFFPTLFLNIYIYWFCPSHCSVWFFVLFGVASQAAATEAAQCKTVRLGLVRMPGISVMDPPLRTSAAPASASGGGCGGERAEGRMRLSPAETEGPHLKIRPNKCFRCVQEHSRTMRRTETTATWKFKKHAATHSTRVFHCFYMLLKF